MDNKNVFIAIALSMSVLLFWGAFFETPQKADKDALKKKLKTETESTQNISPSINETIEVLKGDEFIVRKTE